MNRFISLTALWLIFSPLMLWAQEDQDSPAILSSFENNLDSMLNLWYVQRSVALEGIPLDEIEQEDSSWASHIPDSVYIERLSRIPSIIPLSYNHIVKRYIEVYTRKRRQQVEVMLGLSQYYFPVFEEIFDYYDIPYELKYCSIIESALNPRAISRARAVGMWQFMYGTGRMYDLTINSYVDERRDPVKSTHAAARFMKDLYNIYQDWLLVIAAYNCGPGNVSKAIRRAGGKRDYWDIYPFLPRETRGHVPAFIAAAYTMNYYEEHQLSPREMELPVPTDTLHIIQKLHFKQVSEVMGIPLKVLRDLNPQYRHDIVPVEDPPFSLRIPMEYATGFIDLQDSIFAYKDSIYLKEEIVRSPSYYTRRYVPTPPAGDYTRFRYTVKYGDNLGFIASWYNVGVSDLKYWNGLRGNTIRVGQRLNVYVPRSRASKYANIENMTFAEKQRRIGKPVEQETVTAEIDPSSGDFVYYKVKTGDTIWDIAKKFPGVSDRDIIQINNFSNADRIKPGQVIKIKVKS